MSTTSRATAHPTIARTDPERTAKQIAAILVDRGKPEQARRRVQCALRQLDRGTFYPCGQRFLCDSCRRTASIKIAQEVAALASEAHAANPELRFYLVTLTVGEWRDPKAQVSELRELLQRMMRKRGGHWSLVDGLFWFIDYAKGHGDRHFFHIHALVAVDQNRVMQQRARARERTQSARRARIRGRKVKRTFHAPFHPIALLSSWARALARRRLPRGKDGDTRFEKRVDVLFQQQHIKPLHAYNSDQLAWDLGPPAPNRELVDDVRSVIDYCMAPKTGAAIHHRTRLTPDALVDLQLADLGKLRGRRGIFFGRRSHRDTRKQNHTCRTSSDPARSHPGSLATWAAESTSRQRIVPATSERPSFRTARGSLQRARARHPELRRLIQRGPLYSSPLSRAHGGSLNGGWLMVDRFWDWETRSSTTCF